MNISGVILERRFLYYLQEGLRRIIRNCLVATSKTAPYTPMHDRVLRRRALYRNRLHHTGARCRPVTRVHIDVLAPQAIGTVIRESGAVHFCTAVLAGKIFYRPRERHITAL